MLCCMCNVNVVMLCYEMVEIVFIYLYLNRFNNFLIFGIFFFDKELFCLKLVVELLSFEMV